MSIGLQSIPRTAGRRARAWRSLPATLAVCAAVAAGCARRPPAEEPPARAAVSRGGAFRMAQDAPGSLDPACLDDVYEATIVNQIFDGLLHFDSNLNIIPCIADLWEVSPDGRVYTFHLKPDVRFHDGSELTAADVVYSFTRVFQMPEEDTSLAREYLGHILGSQDFAAGRADSVRGLRALGPYDVRIELEHPFASFLSALASDPSRIVPKDYVERIGNGRFGREPMGCGPFRLARWTENDVILVSHPDYHLGVARLDSLVYELPGEHARDYAARSFLHGRLSAALVPQGRFDEFRTHARVRILTRQELSTTFIGLNENRAPFDDVRVRQAFAYAIDRAAILRRDPTTRIAPNGILPPGMPGYTPESKLLEHDPERARQLLAAAGYPGGRGLPRIVFTTASQTEETRLLLDEISRQVAQVGLQFETETLNWRDFSDRLTAQDLQCFTVTWLADIPDPDSILFPLGHREGAANFTHYRSATVDSLLASGRVARFALDRMAIYREVERLMLNDASIVPLFHPLQALALQQNVRGVLMTPMGIGNIAMEEVWLQTALLAEGKP